MFGYVRPLVGQMLVAENELYRSIYCGLCHALGRHTGCASTLTLSYDFVFLCAFRAAIEGVTFEPQYRRCVMHPVKRRPVAKDNEVFAYAAEAAALLHEAKLRDDIADESGQKKWSAKMLSPAARRIKARVKGKDTLADAINKHLSELSALESANSASMDEGATVFGVLLGDVTAYGLTGTNERIAREVGTAIGRFIYVIDAADDAPRDAETGAYNPILRLYGDRPSDRPLFTVQKTKDRTGKECEKWRLAPDIAENIYIAALNDLSRIEKAMELADLTKCQPETAGIVKNTVYLGMPAELRRVLAL